jgi:hypothetical protein
MSTSKRKTEVEGSASKGNDTTPSIRGYRGKYKPAAISIQELKFDGKCDNLKVFIYNCSDGLQSDRYQNTW